jgi:proteic killer suppression protein
VASGSLVLTAFATPSGRPVRSRPGRGRRRSLRLHQAFAAHVVPETDSPRKAGSLSVNGRHYALYTDHIQDTLITVIKSFRHKGIQKFFETGSTAGIQTKHASKLRIQLTALDSAKGPEDMSAPGWKPHPLKGADLKGHWSIWVNGNYRLTFAFEGEDAVLVDYQDYH